MASDMTLYWGSGSIPCWKPMLVLEEKGLDYNSKLISFGNKEHKSEEIMKLNPRGQVPTFKDGDTVVNESGAICDYLEFKYGDKGTQLLPSDPAQRAAVLQRVYESQNMYKAMIEGLVYYFFQTQPDNIDKELVETKRKNLRDELEKWETIMKDQPDGTFIAGQCFTMADVYVFPMLAFGVRSGMELTAFPKLNDYYKRVLERPSVKATWPPHWKEEPGKNFCEGV